MVEKLKSDIPVQEGVLIIVSRSPVEQIKDLLAGGANIESLEKIKIYDKGVDAPEYTNNFGDFQFSYRYGDILIPNIRFVEPLKVECQHFIDCIKNHTKPNSCGEDGLNVVKVLEAAQKSLVNSGHMEELKW